MKQTVLWRYLLAASLTVLLAITTPAVAQFGTSYKEMKIDVSTYPVGVQNGYNLFATKCSACHDLSSSLKQSRSPEAWAAEVHKMQAMASSHINDREADAIVKFLAYDETHRKAAARKTSSATAGSSPVEAGKQAFESYGCSSCHSVAGTGNTSAPLDGVGSKRTPEELKRLIISPPAGSAMPAMDVPQSDLNNLVAYLLTLKSN